MSCSSYLIASIASGKMINETNEHAWWTEWHGYTDRSGNFEIDHTVRASTGYWVRLIERERNLPGHEHIYFHPNSIEIAGCCWIRIGDARIVRNGDS